MNLSKKIFLIFLIFSHLSWANNLPDLGEFSDQFISPYQEKMIAREILYQVHSSPQVVQDEEINDYLNYLGDKLVSNSDAPQRDFTFFVLKDDAINAFAMLGGLIGVHTGLFISADNESEIASVLGHEIAHVTQKHLQRVIAKQDRDKYKSIFLLALGLLAARSNPQAAAGAMMASQAMNVQNFLDYTREHEQEADRIGIDILYKSGYNVGSAIDFFNTLQKGSRYSLSAPSYLRTHPITSDRISDISDRLKDYPYRYTNNSNYFHFIRGKVRALYSNENNIKTFEKNIKNKTYVNLEGEQYALALAYLKDKKINDAEKIYSNIRKEKNPLIDNLKIDILLQKNELAEAKQELEKLLIKHPFYRAYVYRLAEVNLSLGNYSEVKEMIEQYIFKYRSDPNLYKLLAKAFKGLNKDIEYHENMGEYFYYQYNLKDAIVQFGIAKNIQSNDFYSKSRVESRLKQLQSEQLMLEEGRKNK
ncbi:peptidase M48, Ste24p [beta proteobacterium KB13]|uniref:Peptidase M48, Ste24p n=1 Tax=beta proteobacterium KB13 TaxID=314607 RepID=B6BVE4_9PROT|nr:peptidase M48, Ste24p [beta proteobacterium KB13]